MGWWINKDLKSKNRYRLNERNRSIYRIKFTLKLKWKWKFIN